MSTTETMTIHRALVELKTIDKRIGKAIGEANFCMSAKMNAKKLLGQPTEEFTAKAVSAYDKISELIHRRNAIKMAIPVSNATTKIQVGDKTMTVAEAIVMKQVGYQPYKDLLNQLRYQYSNAVSEVEDENATLDKRTDSYIASLYGGDKAAKAADPKEVEAAREAYIKANTYEVFDGLKQNKQTISSRIEELETMVTTFQNDLDAALSVSNATTTITIEY